MRKDSLPGDSCASPRPSLAFVERTPQTPRSRSRRRTWPPPGKESFPTGPHPISSIVPYPLRTRPLEKVRVPFCVPFLTIRPVSVTPLSLCRHPRVSRRRFVTLCECKMTTRPPTRPAPQPAWMPDSWYCGVLFQNQREKEKGSAVRSEGAGGEAQGTRQEHHNAMNQALVLPAGPSRTPQKPRQSPGCRAASHARPSPGRPVVTAHATGYPRKCELHGCARLATRRACALGDRAFFTRATTRANFGAFRCINHHFTGNSPTNAGKKKRLANCCLRAV